MLLKLISLKITSKIAEVSLVLWIITFSLGVTQFYGMPVKNLLLLNFFIFTLTALCQKNKIIFKNPASLTFLSIGLMASVIIGVKNNFGISTFIHAATLITTILVIIFSFVAYDNKILNEKKIILAINFTAFSGIFIKVSLVFFSVIGFLSVESLAANFENIFGSSFFTANLYGGFLGVIPRISSSGYLFFYLVVLFYICGSKNKLCIILSLILLLLFTVITYSRIFIGLYFVVLCYGLYVLFSRNIRVVIVFIGFFCLLSFSKLKPIYLLLAERFFGDLQSASDLVRIEQIYFLNESFLDNILLGQGLGSYNVNIVRNEINRWHYETEYIALLMQLGLFGFLLIVVNFIIYIIKKIAYEMNPKFVFPVVVALLVWILTPLQSALFVGTSASIIIISIFFLSRKITEQDSPENRSIRCFNKLLKNSPIPSPRVLSHT